jgi:DNA-binding IclR family transcriptional regulator
MPEYSVQVVKDALRILELFDAFRPALTLTVIARESGLRKSKAFRLLNTLQEEGFVERDARGEYQLGPAVRRLERVPFMGRSVRSLIHSTLLELRDRWKETANFALIRGARVVYADIVDSPNPFRVVENIGDQVPVLSTALGRAILAHAARPELFASQAELAQVRNALDQVRVAGYAVDNEETEAGVRCVAVPVYEGPHTLLGALSISGPVQRLPMDRIPAVGTDLSRVALRLQDQLTRLDGLRHADLNTVGSQQSSL